MAFHFENFKTIPIFAKDSLVIDYLYAAVTKLESGQSAGYSQNDTLRKPPVREMVEYVGIEAQLVWKLLFPGEEGLLMESVADYAGMLEGMEAAELLSLVREAKRRLKEMGQEQDTAISEGRNEPPVELYVDRQYHIRLGSPQGQEISFRPLVRALFILFLKHPEGILLKERVIFREELEEIYEVIAPDVDAQDRRRRVYRLTDSEGNAFSENLSVLNATLDRILPLTQAQDVKVQGYNGHPRRVPLSPLQVHWEQ